MKTKMTFKEWFLELMRDERGSVSIKPVVAILGTIFLCSSLMISAYSSKTIQFSDTLVNSIMVITCIGLGADTFDKFSYKRGQSNFGGRQDYSDRDVRNYGESVSDNTEYEREFSVRSQSSQPSTQKPKTKITNEPDLENLPRN
jgi:hypothetical protein